MAKKEVKSSKDKKQKHFLKDFKAEIKKVIWPTPKQLVNSTIAIIVMVIVVAVIVFVLDLAFDAFNQYALTNLQEAAQSVNAEENTDNTTTDEGSTNETSTDGEQATEESTETTENTTETNETSSEETNSQENVEVNQ